MYIAAKCDCGQSRRTPLGVLQRSPNPWLIIRGPLHGGEGRERKEWEKEGERKEAGEGGKRLKGGKLEQAADWLRQTVQLVPEL